MEKIGEYLIRSNFFGKKINIKKLEKEYYLTTDNIISVIKKMLKK